MFTHKAIQRACMAKEIFASYANRDRILCNVSLSVVRILCPTYEPFLLRKWVNVTKGNTKPKPRKREDAIKKDDESRGQTVMRLKHSWPFSMLSNSFAANWIWI